MGLKLFFTQCVVVEGANPPWERIKLQEEEFFASRNRDVAEAKNKAERSQRIQWLSEGMMAAHLQPEAGHSDVQAQAEKRLYAEFLSARRTAEAASLFAHVKGDDGGRYPLTGVGDVNTYALFAETINQITSDAGRSGFIVPIGIATDDSTKAFFSHLTQSASLVSLLAFENEEFIFPAVHHAFRFCMLTIGRSKRADFVFFARQPHQIHDPRRRFTLTPDEFRLISPNTLTCPVFRSERDAELTKKLYRAAPVLIDEGRAEGNPWSIIFMTMFHMSNDSHLFADAPGEGRLPLYEAKLIHQFDHRWATYADDGDSRDVTLVEKADPDFAVTPRYWVDKAEVAQRLAEKGWQHQWLMAWRDITGVEKIRTVIANVVPLSGVGHTLPLFMTNHSPRHAAAMLGNFDSLVLDYVARVKVGGTHLTYGYLKQFPVLPPTSYTEADLAFIVPRVLELTYTAHDLQPWAQDLGYDGEPFTFDPERRAIMRAELDAYYARLYGLTHDELRYILDPAAVMGEDYPSETFRVLKNSDIRQFGTYRTQDLVLQAWDALEAQPPITIPALKPVRRTAPRPAYAQGATPASVAEEWLAGLVCDVLLHAGPCDDTQLHRILITQLPEGIAHADVLAEWLAPLEAGRLPQILGWLRTLLGVPVTAPLSIRDPQALVEVVEDHRTESLARSLIEARRQRDAEVSDVMTDTTPATESDHRRQSG